MIPKRRSGKLTFRHWQGFTVMEVLIAGTIVVVGFLALATMFPTGYATVTKSGIQSIGLALAQQRIEFLRNAAYDNITATTESSIPGYSGYTRTTAFLLFNPDIGAKIVTVTVTLPSAGTPTSQPIQLTTIIAK
ncbi:MAG: hypothetical protein HY574_11335 [candidate division NC10 bacterium]|nr:hypothetical protein [candidate division NC10 bacterium]